MFLQLAQGRTVSCYRRDPKQLEKRAYCTDPTTARVVWSSLSPQRAETTRLTGDTADLVSTTKIGNAGDVVLDDRGQWWDVTLDSTWHDGLAGMGHYRTAVKRRTDAKPPHGLD